MNCLVPATAVVARGSSQSQVTFGQHKQLIDVSHENITSSSKETIKKIIAKPREKNVHLFTLEKMQSYLSGILYCHQFELNWNAREYFCLMSDFVRTDACWCCRSVNTVCPPPLLFPPLPKHPIPMRCVVTVERIIVNGRCLVVPFGCLSERFFQ
jgi:hypothetical protein